MLKTGQKRPNTPNTYKLETDDHWQNSVQVVTILPLDDGTLNFSIAGGSDSGEFAYISEITKGKVNCLNGDLTENGIIIEIQGQKVAGYTRRDTVAWLNHCCRSGGRVDIHIIQPG